MWNNDFHQISNDLSKLEIEVTRILAYEWILSLPREEPILNETIELIEKNDKTGRLYEIACILSNLIKNSCKYIDSNIKNAFSDIAYYNANPTNQSGNYSNIARWTNQINPDFPYKTYIGAITNYNLQEKTPVIINLAKSIYYDRTNIAPILADSLEDLSCPNISLLNHLRKDIITKADHTIRTLCL